MSLSVDWNKRVFYLVLGVLGVLLSCKEDGPELDEILVTRISIKGDFIEDGGSSQLIAEITPENASIQDVTWSVSNPVVATISEDGLLTAVSNGVVTVKAQATDGSEVSAARSFNVSGVTGPVVLVESIAIQGSNIEDGEPKQFSVSILPSEATNKQVAWSVSDESIAEISTDGLLTPLANGSVEVTATATDASGVTGSKNIVISGFPIMVEAITVNALDITDGQPQQLNVQITPADASNQEVTWAVSNTAIAKISEEGILTPIANGTVTITATATDGSEVSGSAEITLSGVTVTGTIVASASDIISALSNASAGDVIYVREGTYSFNSSIRMDANGQSGNLISFLAYPGDERPVFDFSAMSENSSNRGVRLSGDYWHVKGLDVYKAGDNGMFISGHNNLVEFCYFYENADSGLQIGNGASNNTVLNCDSYYNADSSIENADGFACKLDAGDGNKFIGCRAWQNLDDGWDGYMRGNDNITTTYENCWAFLNGRLKDGSVGGGDGNGFKTGGSDDKQLKHNGIFTNCIAAGNVVDGFDHNSNRGDVTLYNCAAHDNGRNINFGTGNIANSLTIKNTFSLGGSGDSYNATTTEIDYNGWQRGVSTTEADFVSIDYELLKSERDSDGSLPDIDYLKLKSGSDLIDSGIDVGLDYNGSAPDIGVFESGG